MTLPDEAAGLAEEYAAAGAAYSAEVHAGLLEELGGAAGGARESTRRCAGRRGPRR